MNQSGLIVVTFALRALLLHQKKATFLTALGGAIAPGDIIAPAASRGSALNLVARIIRKALNRNVAVNSGHFTILEIPTLVVNQPDRHGFSHAYPVC